MGLLFRLFLVMSLCIGSGRLMAQTLTPEQKTADLHQLVSMIKSSYGPLHYKEGLGIDVDKLVAKYEPQMVATTSNGEFYYLVAKFIAEFKDSHFGAAIPTTHSAGLGFLTDLVDGKVLIESVNRSVLTSAVFPFERGDEVVTFNGRPVAEVVQELAQYIGSGYEGTTIRRATMLLTQRSGVRMPVPSGVVTLGIRSQNNPTAVHSLALNWISAGEPLDEDKVLRTRRLPDYSIQGFSISIKESDDELFGERGESSYRCSGATRISIPADATTIMTKPFVAYYHPTPKGNIGYLRIPHYYPNPVTEGTFEQVFANYEYAINELEANTVGLVIDQDHNCGGSVSYLEDMVSLFFDNTFDGMQFELRASKTEYLEFKNALATESNPHTIAYAGFKQVVDLIKTSWERGDYLTPKISFMGTYKHQPRGVYYSKPIVMLIDEMSGSGGDAFPSLMQGYGRAKLIGTRTMGAGGHVVEQPLLNYSGILVRMTKSLFYRPDGVAVENNGAVPDYPYTITQSDFTGSYTGYQAFYLEKLAEMLP